LSVVIACLGLFGLSAFTAEQRIKEIGIRKVLGASVVIIASMLSKFSEAGCDIDCHRHANCVVGYEFLVLHDYAYWIKINIWTFVLAGFYRCLSQSSP
jgi:putative ABC transport system permease protein